NHMAPIWWHSPDVTIAGAPMGHVLGNTNNKVHVIPRRKSGNCNLPPQTTINPDGSAVVLVGLYVCIPGPVIDPTDTTQAKPLGTQAASLQPGANPTVVFDFATSNDVTKPDGPGHKCLIARSYPDALTPDLSSLTYLPDDQHYAQQNICIQV